MSTLKYREKRYIEDLLGMSSGYVLNFSDREFAELFDEVAGIEIHSEKYSTEGSSSRVRKNGSESGVEVALAA